MSSMLWGVPQPGMLNEFLGLSKERRENDPGMVIHVTHTVALPKDWFWSQLRFLMKNLVISESAAIWDRSDWAT
jgi:hypothetical protein